MTRKQLRIALDYKRAMVEAAMRRGMTEADARKFAQAEMEHQLQIDREAKELRHAKANGTAPAAGANGIPKGNGVTGGNTR